MNAEKIRGIYPILYALCAALEVARLVEETQGAFRILNGRGGLELTDNLRAGCVGMIPGLESADLQARIFDLMGPEFATLPRRVSAGIRPHRRGGYRSIIVSGSHVASSGYAMRSASTSRSKTMKGMTPL